MRLFLSFAVIEPSRNIQLEVTISRGCGDLWVDLGPS